MRNTQMVLRSSKRKNKYEAELPAKKRRISTGPLKIIEVIDDCLEHIFGSLNATDLNNVADAHPHLVYAARIIFKRKYSNKMLFIAKSGRMLSFYSRIDNTVEIVNATPKSFFTNFGKLILQIGLSYEKESGFEDAHHWREIEGLIFRYCTKTLTEIGLIHCRGNVMEDIRSPFEKVEFVYVGDGFTEPTKVDLSNWFPNTRQLKFTGIAARSDECMKGNYRFLEQLELWDLQLDDVVEGNIRNFVQSNSHIAQLIIKSIINRGDQNQISVNLLKFLSESLTELQSLYILNLNFKETDSMEHIHFPKVSNLFLQSVEYPENISITFNQLETLELWKVPSNSKWMDFIMQNKSITSLRCGNERGQNIGDPIQIVTGLPILSTLRLWSRSLQSDDLIQLLKACKQVQNLRTIGLLYGIGDLTNEISRIRNMMDNELKNIYERPTVQPFKAKLLSFGGLQSLDICRTFI